MDGGRDIVVCFCLLIYICSAPPVQSGAVMLTEEEEEEEEGFLYGCYSTLAVNMCPLRGLIKTLIFLLLHQQAISDFYSISGDFIGSEGLSIPVYIERIAVNDATVFHYDSNMKSIAPCPDWLNSQDGQVYWKQTVFLSLQNRANMAEALQTAILQSNRSGTFSDVNVYQGSSRCDIYPNGTVKSLLTHAFNGKDYISLDIDNKRFIASVPQAVMYKSVREKNIIFLEDTVHFYKKTCFDRLRMFLNYFPDANRTNAPEVRLFERQRAGSTLLTCHVTGFYPKAVQVKWIRADLQLVDDEMNDVLPNGDGTYQTRRSVIRPEGNTGDQPYSCVVHHSSLAGNITVTWGEEQKPFRLPLWIALICIFMVSVLGVILRSCYPSLENDHL